MAFAAAVPVIVMAIYVMQPGSESPLEIQAAKEKKASPRFGPGILTDSKFEQAALTEMLAPGESGVPPGLAAAADGHLVVNRELRHVMEYFLLAREVESTADRIARMRAYFKSKLPQPAFDEAVQMAANYLKYLLALEKMLADEATGKSDDGTPRAIDYSDQALRALGSRISILRQNMLGANLAQLLFAEEEAMLKRTTAEMREPEAPARAVDTGSAMVPVFSIQRIGQGR
jgi:hypothetical protein